MVMLKIKPLCVCEIREIIGLSMPTISNHLKILREAEIITVTKEDRYMNYKLNADNGVVRDILDLLNDLSDTQIESDKNKALKIDRINIC